MRTRSSKYHFDKGRGTNQILLCVFQFSQFTLSVLLFGPTSRSAAESAAPPIRLLRYEEDYSYLRSKDSDVLDLWEEFKVVRVVPGTSSPFISLGGEIRFQFIEKWDDQFGRVPGAQSSLQQRYLAHADLVWTGHFRIFSQLLSAWEHGRKPGPLPTDADRLDVQQLFAELCLDANAPTHDYLRVGRQEILLGGHQLLKIREGPDVRLAFDGARLHLARQDFDTDVFATNVVQPRPGIFDNSWTDHGIQFSGANLGWTPTITRIANFRTDLFIFDYRNRFVRYEQAAGAEHRQTYGVRASGHAGAWDFDYEASFQGGSLDDLAIRAWGAALFTGYRWDAEPAKPKITLGVSSVTGDRHRGDREINTFNCLFARGDYFGDTSLLTGSNTLDVSLLAECSPLRPLHLSLQWDRLWRSETSDGLYAPPLVYIRNGRASASRDIGDQYTLATTVVVNRLLTVQLIGAVFVAGEFIKASPPNKGTEGLTFRTQFKF